MNTPATKITTTEATPATNIYLKARTAAPPARSLSLCLSVSFSFLFFVGKISSMKVVEERAIDLVLIYYSCAKRITRHSNVIDFCD